MSTATVADYHAARHAHEVALEAACGTRDVASEEVQGYYAQPGDGGAGAARFTFRQWLQDTRVESAEDKAAVRRVAVGLVQDAHQRVKDAEAAYLEATRIRDMEIADANHAGLTFRDIGSLIGVSHAQAQVCAKRARKGDAR